MNFGSPAPPFFHSPPLAIQPKRYDNCVRQPRLGARALKEVFRRVIRDYEFDPRSRLESGSTTLLLDVSDVKRALGDVTSVSRG